MTGGFDFPVDETTDRSSSTDGRPGHEAEMDRLWAASREPNPARAPRTIERAVQDERTDF